MARVRQSPAGWQCGLSHRPLPQSDDDNERLGKPSSTLKKKKTLLSSREREREHSEGQIQKQLPALQGARRGARSRDPGIRT